MWLGGNRPFWNPSRASASASCTTGWNPGSRPAYLRTRTSAAGLRSAAIWGSSSAWTLPKISRGRFTYGTWRLSCSSEPRICRRPASIRMARSSLTLGSRSPFCRSSSAETACWMAWRCRWRRPGVKSEMRSSMPATPVRAASSGANCACTSMRSCAFWLLLGIQSRDPGYGAGAAWAQAKRRVAEAAKWMRMPALLLLLYRLPGRGGRLCGGPLPHQDHDVGRVLAELRRAAHANADPDGLCIADDCRLFRELERVRLQAADLVHSRERLV